MAMHSLLGKVEQVRALFHELELEHQRFQKASGLGCPSGCGACCQTTKLSAAPLEFYPAAYELWQRGRALDMMERALAMGDQPSCALFASVSPGMGLCTLYPHRGLICRLFGFSASRDKHGQPRLIACRILKESPAGAALADTAAITSLEPPIAADWYARLADIDPAQAEVMSMPMALALACQAMVRAFGDCPPEAPSPMCPAA